MLASVVDLEGDVQVSLRVWRGLSLPVRAYYEAAFAEFLNDDPTSILGMLAQKNEHTLEEGQRWAWLQEVNILKDALSGQGDGRLFLEFSIPRMGKRADALLLLRGLVFVLEFKVGAKAHDAGEYDNQERCQPAVSG